MNVSSQIAAGSNVWFFDELERTSGPIDLSLARDRALNDAVEMALAALQGVSQQAE